MLYKIKYIHTNNNYYNSITTDLLLNYLSLYFFNLKSPFTVYQSSAKLLTQPSEKLYSLLLKYTNLKILKLVLLYNYSFKISKFFLPKKYSLTTVLRSPHTDKRSREQFNIIQYKSVIAYPLFFSISNSHFINNYFFFERGFNMVLKAKIMK